MGSDNCLSTGLLTYGNAFETIGNFIGTTGIFWDLSDHISMNLTAYTLSDTFALR